MPIFRKRPVEVEAEQFLVGKPLPFGDRGPYVCFDDGVFFVVTVHGQKTPVAIGDWIILEPKQPLGMDFCDFRSYPCKPDIFEASYEPAVPPRKCPNCDSTNIQQFTADWDHCTDCGELISPV